MNIYDHLYEYPYLQKFCKTNQVPIVPYSHSYSPLSLQDIVVSSYPDNLSDGYHSRRILLNKCLCFSYRNDILDSNLKSRLKGSDVIQFWSSVSELKVGLWLNEQGFSIAFSPPAKGGGVGDYLIKKLGKEIFVEVKTLFGEGSLQRQRSVTERIAQFFQDSSFPVKSINLYYYPNNYEDDWQSLTTRLAYFVNQHLPLKNTQTIIYREKKGIEIEIELNPSHSYIASMLYGGVSETHSYLRTILGVHNQVNNRKPQISADNIPSICILDDFDYNLDSFVMGNALYGNLIEDNTDPTNTTFFRINDGKWSKEKQSELSSVFILQFESIDTSTRLADIYLCPNAKYKLCTRLFSQNSITIWSLNNDGFSIDHFPNERSLN